MQPRAQTSKPGAGAPDYVSALSRTVAGLRVGVVENYFFQGIDAEMEDGECAGRRT